MNVPVLIAAWSEVLYDIQYRHLISAPVDRPSANAWLYKKSC